MSRPARRVTRLAPSPTGSLHLGNARTFLLNWLMARAGGWRVVLRIEDLDGPRVKPGADKAAIADLQWLGIDWDDGPAYQSTRQDAYRAATERLIALGLAYPCVCTRTEIERAASAPHAEDGAAVYPGTCRDRFESVKAAELSSERPAAIRFRVDDGARVDWLDHVAGPQSSLLSRLGDFVVAKSDGTTAYQLAVVIDDAEAGVTDIVRGDDLLDSTPRQMLLYEALQLGTPPRYFHLPLIVGADGRRLAKRHGDTRLARYRLAGAPPGRVLAWLMRCSGFDPPPDIDEDQLTARDLIGRLDFNRLVRHPVVFGPDDDSALLRR